MQDRLAAEADRIIKDSKPLSVEDNRQKCELIDGIGGIKIVKNDTPKEKYLGMAGSGLNKKLSMTQRNMEIRSNSVDKQMKTALDRKDVISTKVLTDSSTINIVPIPTINIVNSNQLPKFKTMPSPTRPSTIFTNNTSNCLKDIFEEQTDAGSSDTSNTTTPKPLRSSALVASTSASENCPPGAGSGSHHRRTKFHKTRTTSCSSSEDEDNAENRKKRANKIIDSSKPFTHNQRRDSHDDSSDSQEQGTNKGSGNAAAGGTSNATLFIRCNKTSNGGSNSGSTQQHSSQNEKNRQKTCTKSSSGTDLGYRRAGRRRPVETRLRESQSLNRITEVQECEVQSGTHIVNNRLSPLPNTDAKSDKTEDDKCDELSQEQEAEVVANEENGGESNTSRSNVQVVIDRDPKNQSPTEQNASPLISNQQSSNSGKTSKSLSARLFQNFKKSSSSRQQKQLHIPSINVTLNGSEDGSQQQSAPMPESAVLSDLDKKSSAHIRSSSNGTSKKIKILGRYFQVSFPLVKPLW